MNAVALVKLKHDLTPGVHAIIWKGEQLTASCREYYDRLNDMFLAGDVRSRQTLEAACNSCHRQAGESLINWWSRSRFDGILTELSLIGVDKEDVEKKAKAIYLIGDEYATLAELLGWKEDVTYMEFQRLKQDRDMRQYGVAREQRLADATSIRRNVQQQQEQRSEGSILRSHNEASFSTIWVFN